MSLLLPVVVYLQSSVVVLFVHRFRSHPGMVDPISAMEERVMTGSMAPGTAADILLDKFTNL